ncbi:hypothetical protein [Microbacterium sp. 179-I 3D3 NHS]|uniref:hypothetical protein n=1 Tax=Microbacterium sp. 179-I 3D3 NHS TaxID=3142382 RepID=UPI0039A2A5C3
MDGLTAVAAAPVRGGSPSRTGVGVHVVAAAGMLALMVPAMLLGHASLAGIAATFAFFAWAAVAARWGRGRVLATGAVGDPFAMGLLMAAPYLALGLGGHAHGAVSGSNGPCATMLLALSVVVGWTALRARAARADFAGRLAFWSCLLMMLGMLAVMSVSPG